jgi:3-oxoacyl-[acyl-carrier-protein] synthase II
MKSDCEVVVTGMGVVSPIGIGQDQFYTALMEGRSGVGVIESFEQTDLPMRIGAPVRDFEAKQYVKPRKALKIMCEPIKFGCAAALMATEQAGLTGSVNEDGSPVQVVSPERIGTVLGTETFFADPTEVARVFRSCIVDSDYQHDRWGEFAMRQIQPLWMLKYLPNMAASHISIAADARGPSNSICQGAASGLLAIIEAASLIKRGACDVVLAGGTGSQMALTAMLYRGTDLLSKNINAPASASRPFDVNRDGMVVGEGAGVMVLESKEHAVKRGANIIASLTGWSRLFCDPLTSADEPKEAAIESSLALAIEDAGIVAADIGVVNASASGVVAEDRLEAQAIRAVLGDVPVSAHKSNFGNLGPGTSVVELIGGLLAIDRGSIPPTINCDQVDPECPVCVTTQACQLEKPSVIKTGFSATGQIASVVFAKDDVA